MMVQARQFSFDAGVAGALLLALVLVFVFDRRTIPANGAGPLLANQPSNSGTGSERPKNLLAPPTVAGTAVPAMGEPPALAPETAVVASPTTPEVATVAPQPLAAEVPRAAPLDLPMASLYSARTLPNRAEWVPQVGGTTVSEQAVEDGLDWLARHQAADGSWGCGCLGPGENSLCEPGGGCSSPGQHYDIAHTALAVLAFQAGGHYHFNQSKYSEVVRQGLDWLVDQQTAEKPPESQPTRPPRSRLNILRAGTTPKFNMYEQGISAFALSEACALAHAARQPAEKYRTAALRGVRFVEAYQHRDGGWRYDGNLGVASDTSVSGWQVLALKTALSADLPVEPECLEKVRKFFQTCEIGDRGRTGYQDSSQITEATTGVGMLVHQFVLHEPDSPLVKAAAPFLANFADQHWGDKQGRAPDFYLWYNCTLAMFQVGGDDWDKWNAAVRDSLIHLQLHTGCERGSWDPTDRWGQSGGRIYSTALAVLTLEVYYRFANERLARPQADPPAAKPAEPPPPAAPK